jgi:hypothetical protein
MVEEAKQGTGMEQAARKPLSQDSGCIAASPSTNTWYFDIEPCLVSWPDCDVQSVCRDVVKCAARTVKASPHGSGLISFWNERFTGDVNTLGVGDLPVVFFQWAPSLVVPGSGWCFSPPTFSILRGA